MKRGANKTAYKKSRGMTLIEVVVALGVLVLIFAMFSMFLNTANNMNMRAMEADTGLSQAEAGIYTSAPSGSGKLTLRVGGSAYSYDVDIYSAASSDGEVILRRFAP